MSEEHRFSDEDRQQVAQSLESIVRIVLSKELEVLRDSIADVDSRLSERVESVAERATSRMDQMRDHVVPGFEELRSKLTEVEENRERSMAGLDDRLAQATAAIREEIRGFSDGLEEPKREIQKLREEIQEPTREIGSLRDRLEDSKREIEALRDELSESKQENGTLKEASEKSEKDIEALREQLRRPVEQIEELKLAVEEPKQQLESVRDALQKLTDQLQDIREQSDNRIEIVKATLEQEIAGGDANLMEQLNGIVGDFNQLQDQITQQTKTSQHLSGVLTNLASIFTTQRGTQQPSSVPASPTGGGSGPPGQPTASESKAQPDESSSGAQEPPAPEGGNVELEKALNRVFPLES